MNDLAQVSADALPVLLSRAKAILAGATTSAEILEARDAAGFAYDLAKRRARISVAKSAHDDVIGAAYRLQAEALLIEARAKVRLADEYDAAQERGEIASAGKPANVPDGNNKPTVEDVGLTRKQIHDARQVRDAEEAQPGVIQQILDQRLANGLEPTRAAIREAVIEAAKPTRSPDRKNPKYRPDPQFDAMLAVSGGCRDMMDEVRELEPQFVIGGFVDEAQRERNLASIRECRDYLTRLLEYADAH